MAIQSIVEPIFDYQFRLILIGDTTVGKSSLLKYFTDGNFSEMIDPTVGVDFFARLIEVQPGVRVKLQLWDTAGQERFRSITKSYYRNSVGAFLIYDISQRKTFEHLEDWLAEAHFHIAPNRAVFVVVGHKADKESVRAVTTREGAHFAEQHGLRFVETSAKTGQNVEEAFMMISRAVYEMLGQGTLALTEGWQGVKAGYGRPAEAFSLQEKEAEQGMCC